MPTQTQLQDGKALTLGALFLVDNAPECPEEMSWHDFSDWAIAEHLKRHSYYQHQKGNRKLVTVAKMRSRVLYLCNNYAKPGMPKPDHKEFKDKVDVLFGYGRTRLLKKDLLGALGYDRDTFSESRLNKHASYGDRPASAKTDRRPETETAKEDRGSDASNKNSHGVGEQECRVGEAHATDPISTQPTLPSPPSNGFTSLLPPDNDQTAPNSNSIEIREGREQNETTTGEQPRPSRSEGRRRRSSVSSQTRPLIADNGALCVSEEPSAASSGNINPREHDECVVGAKRKHKQDHGPHKRQCQVDNTARQDDSNGREPPSNSTPQAEQASKVPPTVNGSKGPEAPRDAVTNRKNQHQLQLARLNLDQQGRNMKSLYSDIQDATDVILSSIGKIRNTPSPLHPKSSGPLKDLYAKCWGPQWEEVRIRQIEDHVFTTPQVTTSLLSAFLYDRVLARGARLEEIVSNVVKMGGSLGEALLDEFDISTRGETIAKRARMIEAQQACSRLAQNDEILQQQLKLEAETLAGEASVIMAPHLAALSCSAKLFGLSSNRPETDALKVSESEFTKVVQKTLHYRLQLLATGCEYAFTWPNPDDVFSSRNMQIDGRRSENTADQSIVLFTVFPGLEIKPMSSDEMESPPDAKAAVKVQRSEDRLR